MPSRTTMVWPLPVRRPKNHRASSTVMTTSATSMRILTTEKRAPVRSVIMYRVLSAGRIHPWPTTSRRMPTAVSTTAPRHSRICTT